MSLPAAFAAKTFTVPSACIIWTGALNSKGYGCFAIDGTSYLVHRLAYEAARGPIPDGMTIDHLCRSRRCINVDHLEVVTRGENARRAWRQPDCCPQGHMFTPANTRIKKCRDGGTARICRECSREFNRAYRARKKAEVAA